MRAVFSLLIILAVSGCSDSPVSPDPTAGFPDTGALSMDSSSYYSTNSSAVITLVDSDLAGEAGVSITVASSSDPAGIQVILTNSGDRFIGVLGFSLSNSLPGNTIKISEGDIILASYNDAAPAGSRTAAAWWWDTLRYGIYCEISTSGKLNIDMPDADPDAGFFAFANAGYHSMPEVTTNARDGSKSLSGYLENDSFLIYFNNFNDLGIYSGGNLHFSIIATNDLTINVEWDNGSHEIQLAEYAALAGSWEDITIPLSRFTNINMHAILTPISFHFYEPGVRAYFTLDRIYLEK